MGIKRERASERYVKQTERERHKEYKRILRERGKVFEMEKR